MSTIVGLQLLTWRQKFGTDQGRDPVRCAREVRGRRVRGGNDPGDRRRRRDRPGDGDALFRQQRPAVRRRRRVRPAVPRLVRRRPPTSVGEALAATSSTAGRATTRWSCCSGRARRTPRPQQRMQQIFVAQLAPMVAGARAGGRRDAGRADRDADPRPGPLPVRAEAATDRRDDPRRGRRLDRSHAAALPRRPEPSREPAARPGSRRRSCVRCSRASSRATRSARRVPCGPGCMRSGVPALSPPLSVASRISCWARSIRC